MKRLNMVAAALVIVGAVNWGLVGLFKLDLVAAVFGMQFGAVSPPSAVVYTLVGIAGLYRSVTWGGGRHELTAAKN